MTLHFLLAAPDAAVPPRTLGIEVASPELAARCDLGNVSGTWWPNGPVALRLGLTYSPETDARVVNGWSGRAAVDIATEVPLPPPGATLLLGRLDLGTVAAAAVLVLRALGLAPKEALAKWDFHVMRRICQIATRATYRPSADWTPRPLPTLEQPWPAEPLTWHEDRELAAVAAICAAPMPALDTTSSGIALALSAQARTTTSPVESTRGLSLAERVAFVASWMLEGEPHDGFAPWPRRASAQLIAGACGITRLDSIAILAARIDVEASRRALAEARGLRGTTWDAAHGVAIVRLDHPDALELGFCVAPVVVWIEPGDPKGPGSVWSDGREEHTLLRQDHAMGVTVAQIRGRDGSVDLADLHEAAGWTCVSAAPGRVTIAGWAGPDGRTRCLDIDALYLRLHTLEWHAAEGILANAPGLWVGQDNVIRTGVATLLSEEVIVREVVACLL